MLPKQTLEQKQAGGRAKAKRRPGWSISQLTDFQLDLHARLKDPDLCARDAAQVARAWKELETLRLEKIGHGKPKPVTAKNDPGLNKTKRTVRSAPIVLPAPPEQEKQA